MGCDIHYIVERNLAGIWVSVKSTDSYIDFKQSPESEFDPFLNRDYTWFAAIAGVRGEGPPPKGLPDDASVLARHMYEDGNDYHSWSWMTLSEWLISQTLVYGTATDLGELARTKLDNSFNKWVDTHYPRLWVNDLNDYRVIFYFDN